jgi:hypothetical protein
VRDSLIEIGRADADEEGMDDEVRIDPGVLQQEVAQAQWRVRGE